jgi:K+-sensing histidine kinase KdpD
MVSHELRNPITTIYTGARILLKRFDTLDETARNEVLIDVEQEAERLQLIVENLLALAREEFAPKAEPEPVSVNRTIEAAVSRVKKAKPSRKINFSRNGEAYASIVPIYLDLVLRNLLDNADKYSPRDAPIELAASQDTDSVIISVRDHGPGVSEEALARLFERFYREPTVASVSGAGIGLTVCQRLLENQGGTIACDNHPEGGFRCEVRLPAYSIESLA